MLSYLLLLKTQYNTKHANLNLINYKFELGTIYHDHQDPINMNASNKKSDIQIVLDNLFEHFPKVEWIIINIAWFTDKLNIADINIYPTCDYKEGMYSSPHDWSVAQYNRSSAKLAQTDKEGNFLYGGTPADSSILRFVAELKRRNLKVIIHPLLLVENEERTWRGKISGLDSHLEKFYNGEKGYTAFITHYANLLKDYIDGFILGSEMVGINKSSAGKKMLALLAQKVKSIFSGKNITLTYGADILEYRELQTLWESNAIDVIGINAFFNKGHYFNPNDLPTSKKIWFTQWGFPSIKNCTAEPKYGIASKIDQNRIIDFAAQEKALLETHQKFTSYERVEQVFLYYYDTNPNIHLSEYNDPDWPFNHSVNFKSTNIGIEQILEDLIKDLPERENILLDLYNQTFQGAIIKGFKNYHQLLQMLGLSMNYQYYEEDGKIVISNKTVQSNYNLEDYQSLLVSHYRQQKYTQINKIRVYYISAERDYNLDYIDYTVKSTGLEFSLFFPFVTNNNYALKIAESAIVNSEKFNTGMTIKLPYHFYDRFGFSYYHLNGKKYLLKRKAIEEDGMLKIDFIAG